MDAAGPPGGVDDAVGTLRGAGLRATQPRIAVYELLGQLGGHRSADELFEHLDAADPGVSRASVYNALRDLTAAGVVAPADTGPGLARYELASRWHHHFVCRRCGRIIDVPCVVGAKPCLEASLAGAEIDEAQVIFRGLCPSCAQR